MWEVRVRVPHYLKLHSGSSKPRNRMDGRGFSNMCPVSLLINRTHWGEDETLIMDRLAGGKTGPDLLLPAPSYQLMSLSLALQARGRVLSQRHFIDSVGGSAGPGLDRGILHTPRQKVLRVFPVCHPMESLWVRVRMRERCCPLPLQKNTHHCL